MKHTNEMLSALKRTYLGAEFSAQDTIDVIQFASIRKYKAEEYIFRENQIAESFFLVLKGQIKIFRVSATGKEVVLNIFKEGQTIAEQPIYAERPFYPASAQALEISHLLAIHGASFRIWARQHPDILLKIMASMSRRLHVFNCQISRLALCNVDSRLAHYLLSLSADQSGTVKLLIPKKTLASMLGTIPETLSRAFKRLVADKLIRLTEGNIVIQDREKLRALAEMETKNDCQIRCPRNIS